MISIKSFDRSYSCFLQAVTEDPRHIYASGVLLTADVFRQSSSFRGVRPDPATETPLGFRSVPEASLELPPTAKLIQCLRYFMCTPYENPK